MHFHFHTCHCCRARRLCRLSDLFALGAAKTAQPFSRSNSQRKLGPPRRVNLVNSVPPKGRRHFWGIWFPMLTHWARFCYAYGVLHHRHYCPLRQDAALKAAALHLNLRQQQTPSGGGIARRNGRRGDGLERDGRAIDVPEIAVRFCEFDGDLPAAAEFRIDKHYAAFALFFCEAVHDKDLLAEFYWGLHVEQPAIQADGHGGGYIAEGTVSGSASVNFDGNRIGKARATAALDHRNLLSNPKNWRSSRLSVVH